MAANWTDFIRSPGKESKRLHVSPRDVVRGASIDAAERARRAFMGENARLRALEETAIDPRDAMFVSALFRDQVPTEFKAPPRTLGDALLDKSETMRQAKEFYDARSPAAQRSLLALSMLPAIAAPAAMGAGALTRMATGAVLNSALGIPLAALEPEMYDPARDAGYGVAFGLHPLAGIGTIAGDTALGAVRKAGGGAINSAANKFQKMLAHLGKENTTLLPAALDDAADEAVHLYIANPALFRGDAGTQRRAVQYMLQKGQMTPEQISRMPTIKKTLLDVLDQQLPLDTPLYRGTVRPANERPAYHGDVVGGDRGPASFSWSPTQALDFLYGAGPQDKSIMLRSLGSHGVRGITVPYEAEFETLLHPANRFRGQGVTPIQGEGSIVDMIPAPELFGKDFDYGAWRNGGPVRKAGGGVIKRLTRNAMSAMSPEGTFTTAPQGALSVVKNKGGNWLSGSVEDALRGLKPEAGRTAENRAHSLAAYPGNPSVQRQISIADWIDKQLTRYVKNDMATPEDPIRALAERGVVHYGGPREAGWQPYYNESVKSDKVLGVSDLAKDWERLTDTSVRGTSVGNMLEKFPKSRIEPWMEKADPASLVYETRGGQSDARQALGNFTGFNHLVDELSNALNPESGLPRTLQLRPDQLNKVSVPQAVELVSKINAHRAAEQAAANAELAGRANLVRDYPHSDTTPNPKGLRWVELKASEKAPEGWVQQEVAGAKRWVDPQGRVVDFKDDPVRAELERQLKYEGDTMGHCVGGYCNDVLSGRSRIFSLRDAKGEPHVTVEVNPKGMVFSDVVKYIGKEEAKRLLDEGVTLSEMIKNIPDFQRQMSITQIKGKANRKPNDEYLPFVQDFVRNSPLGGQWSDVGDIQNTGLRRVEDAFNKNELAKLRAANVPVPEGYATSADIEELHKQFNLLTTGTEFNPARAWERMPMAKGGPVKQSTPTDNFQGIIAAIEQELRDAA